MFKRGNPLSWDDINNKIPPYPDLLIEYVALVKAIPKEWINLLRNTLLNNESSSHVISIHYLNTSLQDLGVSNKKLRLSIVSMTATEICGRNFWKNKFDSDISGLYAMAKNATCESRLRLLQFKLLHNIYPSNILLKRMGIRTSELCDHCGVKDFIEHMFIDCKLLYGFWDRVFNEIFLFTSFKFEKSDCNILFGFSYSPNVTNVKTNIANHILLIAKLSVSKARYGELKNVNIVFDSELSVRKQYLIG